MDIKWLVLVLCNGFIFVHCKDCASDKLKYLAKIDIIWDESSELVHRGLGSLIHPHYVLTAGSFVFDYHKVQNADDSKYPVMEVHFPNSDEALFKVQEVIIMKHIYDSQTSDFALIKLEIRPNFTPGYMRAEYKKTEKTLSDSKQYYLGTLEGIVNISPTDPDSVLTSIIIDTTSEKDNFEPDDRIGAPLFFCDQERGQYVQAGIFSSFDPKHAHQRNTNLLMLTETIYNYIAEHSFSKCYKKNNRRINDGEARFHRRAQLGDSLVHIYATTYSSEGKPSQRRCSGSIISSNYIVTAATCLRSYIVERQKTSKDYKLVIKVGIKDEVNHPNVIINERDIQDVILHQHRNPEDDIADLAVIFLVADIYALIDKNDQIHLTPVHPKQSIGDFDGDLVMFIGIDRNDNKTFRDSIGSALYRVDQVLCNNPKNADLCLTSQFIAPWRVPQKINIGGTFYICDKDNQFKQIAMLKKQEGFTLKAVWLPDYLLE